MLGKHIWQPAGHIIGAAKEVANNLNYISAMSVILTTLAVLTIWIAHPTLTQTPNVLRAIATIFGVSASFMANTNLSRQQRTNDQVKADKRIALLLTCSGAVVVGFSFLF